MEHSIGSRKNLYGQFSRMAVHHSLRYWVDTLMGWLVIRRPDTDYHWWLQNRRCLKPKCPASQTIMIANRTMITDTHRPAGRKVISSDGFRLRIQTSVEATGGVWMPESNQVLPISRSKVVLQEKVPTLSGRFLGHTAGSVVYVN